MKKSNTIQFIIFYFKKNLSGAGVRGVVVLVHADAKDLVLGGGGGGGIK
jgi:hypothetical protein